MGGEDQVFGLPRTDATVTTVPPTSLASRQGRKVVKVWKCERRLTSIVVVYCSGVRERRGAFVTAVAALLMRIVGLPS